MLFASVVNDLILAVLVIGFLGNVALNRMFGPEWPQQVGQFLKARWLSERQ